jgi:uncharacterized protein
MIKSVEIKIFPDKLHDIELQHHLALSQVKAYQTRVRDIILTKRSIDARGRRPIYLLRFDVYIDENYTAPVSIISSFTNVSNKRRIIIVGAGPAGYFAALQCISLGLKPLIVERGKDVRERRRDLKAIQQLGEVNPDSNYCFGEGGAGTYSDGKLYTRSHKRGSIASTLQLLVEHGANPDILIDAHPHIGSNKLPTIIASIRETIEKNGGEVLFNQRVIDFIIENGQLIGVKTSEKEIVGEAIILATGHSARDIYALCDNHKIQMEAKPFALGLRIEHQQSYIDQKQYKQTVREENLPASSYAVVTQVANKGVFSFCMCPGGLVVPAATAPGEIVVNGMSLSRRDSAFANSGFVTSIELDELAEYGYKGVMASLDFQRVVEKAMFDAGNGSQAAPAQRVKDFVDGVISPELNPTSYIPGLISAPLHQILPTFVYRRLRQGLIDIDKKMKGYLTNEANIIGTESRTSAPIKIPRNPESLMHEGMSGLFPCGEGAGYAGGILSAAMDGQNVAKAVYLWISKKHTS